MSPSNLNDNISEPASKAITDQAITDTKSKRNAAFFTVIAWILLTAVSAFINRQFVHASLFESGDFAADSMLVQDAKHLQLFVGHYSRVGFNHPGPALLYVLAAGEWLLFDCLHIVASPLSGQIFAVGAYSAFWLSAMGLLFFRMQRSISAAAISWFFFATITAYVDHVILDGIWPPHLLYLPFATFTLALMRLLKSQNDSLLILTLSCGFLVHGHVSFIPICGLMLGGTLVLNWWRTRKTPDQAAVFSRQFIVLSQRSIAAITAILILFLLPLLIETLRNFPGPLIKYTTYGSENKPNDIGNALAFVAQYWGFRLLPLLTGMLALHFFTSTNVGRYTGAQYTRGAAPVLLLSTAAVLFYAVNGIDNLNSPYLGIFYYTTPAIAIALMFSDALLHTNRKVNAAIAIVLALIALPFIYRQTAKTADYASFYSDPKIPQYFEKITALDKSTIVLDLDQNSGWGRIWTTIVGIEVYAARHEHHDLFCIGKNWHILFAKKARCTQSQLEQSPHFFVSTATLAPELGQRALDLDGLEFYKLNAIRP